MFPSYLDLFGYFLLSFVDGFNLIGSSCSHRLVSRGNSFLQLQRWRALYLQVRRLSIYSMSKTSECDIILLGKKLSPATQEQSLIFLNTPHPSLLNQKLQGTANDVEPPIRTWTHSCSQSHAKKHFRYWRRSCSIQHAIN